MIEIGPGMWSDWIRPLDNLRFVVAARRAHAAQKIFALLGAELAASRALTLHLLTRRH